jgi:hypothetical protein
MGLLFWKSNKKIDAFGNALADDLFSYVQPDAARRYLEGEIAQKKKQHKLEQKFSGIVYQIKQFGTDNSLGVYGKARLQKAFSDRLLELGYDAAVTKKLVERILLRVA